jgi:hypothetical protein
MKTIINIVALTALAVAAARAGTITVTFDQPNQTGRSGDTLHFWGVIANTGTDTDPANAVCLNGDSFNFSLTPASYEASDNFGSTPIFLTGGGSSGHIDLFDITLNVGTSDPFGAYAGTYGLIGGQDGGDLSGQDNLAQADFSINVVTPGPR